MTTVEDIYWIETDSFVQPPFQMNETPAMVINEVPFHMYHMYMLNIHKIYTTLVFHASKFFHMQKQLTICSKPEPLNATQHSDLFVTYTNSFNMHTGQPNPRSVINEYISSQIVLDTNKKTYVFPALKVSNNFATIDYDAHIDTEIDDFHSTKIKYSS